MGISKVTETEFQISSPLKAVHRNFPIPANDNIVIPGAQSKTKQNKTKPLPSTPPLIHQQMMLVQCSKWKNFLPLPPLQPQSKLPFITIAS